MMARFNKTGANAGAAKWPRTLRMPIQRATNPTKKIYGNINRVRAMVSASLSAENPGAINRTIHGDNITPQTTATINTILSNLKAERAR